MEQFFCTPTFYKSFKRMKRARQINDKAVGQVNMLIGSISSGDKNPLKAFKTTNHGETRIKKCVKYDLHNFCRLVTVKDGEGTTLLFVGDHDDEEEWLNRNKGMVIGIDEQQKLGKTYVGSADTDGLGTFGNDKWSGKLIDRLDESKRDIIFKDINYAAYSPIQKLDSGENDETILSSVAFVEDQDLKETIQDTLILLNRGEVEEAEKRIDIYSGLFKSLDQLSPEEMIEVTTDNEIKRIPINSPEYMSWVEAFINSDQSFDWFLFMHPEQEKYVNEEYGGPVILSGVSGSGKTAVAIARAVRLAKKYKNEKILVITLNKALADLISQIIDHACSDTNITQRIDVKCYFDVAIDLIYELEPHRKELYKAINDLDEHKDEIFREFYRCMLSNLSAEVMLPTHYHLVGQNIDAEKYISEEFDWIRSTLTEETRKDYLEIQRKGRGFPLAKSYRENLLKGLDAWEKKMRDVGVIDTLGITMAIRRHTKKIKAKYRSIIVDEVQDFGTSELTVLRLLAEPNENDMFLCGDAAQQIQPKCQNFPEAGIDIKNRSFNLQKNYRNSKEILALASSILIANLADEHLEHSELEISDPELATRSSMEPILLTTSSLEHEIAFALQIINENASDAKKKDRSHIGCVAIAGFTQFEIEEFGKTKNLHVLNGEKKLLDAEVFLSDLEQTKGFEFDTMVIVNCNEGILPPVGIPREEMYRFVSQFYVAMTRAKDQLILSCSTQKSKWLDNQKVDLPEFDWTEFIEQEDILLIGSPGYLPEFPGEPELSIDKMSGMQFIYTDTARGLSPEVLKQIVISENIEELFKALTQKEANQIKKSFGNAGIEFTKAYLNAIENKKHIMERNDLHLFDIPINEPEIIPTPNTIIRTAGNYSPIDKDDIENPISDIKLNPRDFALLHALGLRTLEDVLNCESHKLRKHFAKKRIVEIKKKAQEKRKLNAAKAGNQIEKIVSSIRLEDAGFTRRTQHILMLYKVKNISDIEKVNIESLKNNSQVGNSQLLEIKRIATKHGVDFKL